MSEQTKELSHEEFVWRAFAAIRSAAARLSPFTESPIDHVTDENLEWAAAVGADEIRDLLKREPGSTGEAGWSLGKAAGVLVGIGAIAVIAGRPQTIADVNSRGWGGYDRSRLGNAAGYLPTPAPGRPGRRRRASAVATRREASAREGSMSGENGAQPVPKYWTDVGKPEHPSAVLKDFGDQLHILAVTQPFNGCDLTDEYAKAIRQLYYDFARARQAVEAWVTMREVT